MYMYQFRTKKAVSMARKSNLACSFALRVVPMKTEKTLNVDEIRKCVN